MGAQRSPTFSYEVLEGGEGSGAAIDCRTNVCTIFDKTDPRNVHRVLHFAGSTATFVGDYAGDGRADFAVYRPSNGGWFVNGAVIASWGVGGDVPVPCDYNGNGRTDFAIYRPSIGGSFVNGGAIGSWGIAGDVPLQLPHAIRLPSTGLLARTTPLAEAGTTRSP